MKGTEMKNVDSSPNGKRRSSLYKSLSRHYYADLEDSKHKIGLKKKREP